MWVQLNARGLNIRAGFEYIAKGREKKRATINWHMPPFEILKLAIANRVVLDLVSRILPGSSVVFISFVS